MRYTVVLTGAFPEVVTSMLAAHFDVVGHPNEARSEDDVITILAEADAAIVLPTDPITRRVLSENPNLRMVACVGAGDIDAAAAQELGVVVVEAADEASAAIAVRRFLRV
jgi:lactate dehydrogenase-like 2-hydroxyacid dehydrogenase